MREIRGAGERREAVKVDRVRVVGEGEVADMALAILARAERGKGGNW